MYTGSYRRQTQVLIVHACVLFFVESLFRPIHWMDRPDSGSHRPCLCDFLSFTVCFSCYSRVTFLSQARALFTIPSAAYNKSQRISLRRFRPASFTGFHPDFPPRSRSCESADTPWQLAFSCQTGRVSPRMNEWLRRLLPGGETRSSAGTRPSRDVGEPGRRGSRQRPRPALLPQTN